MRFGSLFSGCGTFDLGFERAGLTCVWQCEIDATCRDVLAKHWPSVERYQDVKGIDGNAEPVELICGGFPCQDLSVAGKRAGLAGERSGLFFEFMRIAAALRPRWLLIENVPGLLSSNRERDMGTVLGSLAKLGYWYAYRVLDAQYFGVAQRRERVFIAASLGGPGCGEVLFEPESLPGDSAPRREAGARVARCLANGTNPGRYDGDSENFVTHIAACLNSGGNAGGFRTEPGEHLVAHTLRGEGFDADEDGTGRGTPLVPVAYNIIGGGQQGKNHAYEATVSGCLQHKGLAASGNEAGTLAMSQMRVRRLTPRECERLQGLPDDWTRYGASGKEISDSRRYRMIGNAGAVPVLEWIGRRIMDQQHPTKASGEHG